MEQLKGVEIVRKILNSGVGGSLKNRYSFKFL
jgi:hypothetical protein